MQDNASLPQLPREVVVRVFERLPILAFLRGAVATCRQFSLKWYLGRSFQNVVVVPDEEQSINAAMNRLAREGYAGQGLVLVRPGLYSETVRVTQNCDLVDLASPVVHFCPLFLELQTGYPYCNMVTPEP